MKYLVAAIPVFLLAACGSPARAPVDTSSLAPMIYLSSQRSPSSIASCLEDRLSRVQSSREGSATELAVGSSSHASYYVELLPSSQGSVVRVTHPADASNDPPEEELRFDIARCAI